jgi:hypothetical protein
MRRPRIFCTGRGLGSWRSVPRPLTPENRRLINRAALDVYEEEDKYFNEIKAG